MALEYQREKALHQSGRCAPGSRRGCCRPARGAVLQAKRDLGGKQAAAARAGQSVICLALMIAPVRRTPYRVWPARAAQVLRLALRPIADAPPIRVEQRAGTATQIAGDQRPIFWCIDKAHAITFGFVVLAHAARCTAVLSQSACAKYCY